MEERNPTTNAAMDEALAGEIDRRVREALERVLSEHALPPESGGDSREAALDERERKIAERETRAAAQEQLAERGLPRELAGALPCGDAAALEGALDALEAAFRSAVQAEVDKRLRGRMPSGAGVGRPDPDSLTDAEYYRLSAGRTAAQDAGAR